MSRNSSRAHPYHRRQPERSAPPQGSRRRPFPSPYRPARPTEEVATWTVLSPSGHPVGWHSRLEWSDQPQVLVGTPRTSVPAPFQGLTIAERHPVEPRPVYTQEELAALCEVCQVPEISWRHHRAGALHRERSRALRANRPEGNNSQDALEEALAMLRRLRPDQRRQAMDAILDSEDCV